VAEQKVVGLTPNPPAPNDWVELTHKDIDKPMQCSPKAVAHWTHPKRGWVVAESDVDAPVTAEQVAVEQVAVTDELSTADPVAVKKAPRAGSES
jgi:hypothetical protein